MVNIHSTIIRYAYKNGNLTRCVSIQDYKNVRDLAWFVKWWDIFGKKLLDTIRINPPYQVTLRYAYQYCLASVDMNGHEHSNQNRLMANLFIWVIKKESKRFFRYSLRILAYQGHVHWSKISLYRQSPLSPSRHVFLRFSGRPISLCTYARRCSV